MTEPDGAHTNGGNCWSPEAIDCEQCGGNTCDICHAHEQLRGECEECVPCGACEDGAE